MKLFRAVIICLIIGIFILSAGSVGAQDFNESAMISDDSDIDISQESFTDFNNILKSNTSSIQLDNDYTYNKSNDYSGGISVEKQLTIDGNGHTINGNGIYGILKINAPNVVLKNINFINSLKSAVTVNSENITLINCNFINNSAGDDYGGALYFKNTSSPLIKNCSFINNSAYLGGAISSDADIVIINSTFINNYAGKNGAAVFSSSNVINVTESLFENNYAGGSGVVYSYINDINVINSTFTANRASCIVSNANVCTVSSCFINNSACVNIYTNKISKIANSTFLNGLNGFIQANVIENIINSTFGNNSANFISAVEILKNESTLFLSDSIFTQNTAKFSAGAISSKSGIIINNSTFFNNAAIECEDIQVTNSRFLNNSAISSHGNVFVSNSSFMTKGIISAYKNTTILNSSFINASAVSSSGNLKVYNSKFINRSGISSYDNAFVSDSIFIKNYNAIKLNFNGHLQVNNSIFTNNNGGAIISDGNVDIVNSSFINNSASYGSAISTSANASVFDSIFLNNSAGYGGAISSGDLYILNSTFLNNSASYGGAIYSGDLYIVNSTFLNNSARYHGGAVSSSDTIIINSSFINNSANDVGAVSSQGINVNNSYFENNRAKTGSGGAIDAYHIININDSVFLNNSAYKDGGAVRAYGHVNTDNSTFVYNSASSGGAIYCLYSDVSLISVKATNSSFINNHADKNGGAVYCDNIINITSSTLDNNSKTNFYTPVTIELNNTEKIYFHDNLEIMVKINELATGNVTFNVDGEKTTITLVNGSATLILYDLKYGRVDVKITYSGDDNYSSLEEKFDIQVYTVNSYYDLSNLIDIADSGSIINLTNNYACYFDFISIYKPVTINGNGHVLDSNNLSFTFSVYSDNVTLANLIFINGADWGVVYTSAKNTTFINCTFINNHGEYNSGVIYCDGGTVNILNSTFVNNSAVQPTVLCKKNGIINIDNCIFINNYVENNAGVIYCTKGSVEISNSTFINNHATKNAGVIYCAYGKVNISNSNFINNSAAVNGGVIYNNDIVEITSSSFTANSASSGSVIYNAGGFTNAVNSKFENHSKILFNCPTGNITVSGSEFLNGLNFTKNVYIINSTTDKKMYSKLDISCSDIRCGEDLVIILNINDNIQGNVLVTVGDVYNTTVFIDTYTNLTVYNLPVGTYNIHAIWQGNDLFLPASANCTVEVISNITRITPEIMVSYTNVYPGEDLVLNIVLDNNITGTVKCAVNGVEYNVTVYNGEAIFTLHNVSVGNYTFNITYDGDEYYNPVSCYIFTTIYPISANIKLSVNNLTVTASLSKGATGNITFYADNIIYKTLPVVNGSANLTFNNLDYGYHTITAVYNGDNNYLPSNTTTRLYVPDNRAKLYLYTTLNDDLIITLYVSDNSNGTAYIYINANQYTEKVTDGRVKLTISDLPAGTYNITAVYNNLTANKTITVSKINPVITVSVNNIIEGDDAVITVNSSSKIYYITVTVNNITYTQLPNSILTIANLTRGTYDITVSYNGSDKYNAYHNITSFAVKSDDDYNSSFKYLQSLIDNTAEGEILYLSDDYVYDYIIDSNPIVIDKTITINGNNHFISGSLLSSIFIINASNVVLDSLWLNNANGSAVVITSDNITIINSLLENNTGDMGSAVLSYSGNNKIINSTFRYNYGAIFFTGDNSAVSNSTFTDNYASSGSAVAISGSGNVVENSSFINNTAFSGAVVDAFGFNTKLQNLIFAGNTPTAVELNSSSAVIDNSSFINSAVVNSGVNLTINNSLFKYSNYSLIDYGLNTTVVNSVFTDNYNHSIIGLGDALSVVNSTFMNNNAESIISSANNLKIITSIFVNNSDTCIILNSTGALIDNSTFTGNNETVIVVYANNTTVQNSYFKNNVLSNLKVNGDLSVYLYNNYGLDVEPLLFITTNSIKYGENLVVDVYVPYTKTGSRSDIILTVGSLNYTSLLDSNHAEFTIANLNAGTYAITATLIYDNESTLYSNNTEVYVAKLTPVIDLTYDNITAGENLTVYVNTTVTGVIRIADYTLNSDNTIIIPDLAEGTYEMVLVFEGDVNYESVSINFTVTVKTNKTTPEISVIIENLLVKVYLSDNAEGNVTVTVAGKSYTVPLVNSGAQITVDNLDYGVYDITVTYNGDDSHFKTSLTEQMVIENTDAGTFTDLQTLINNLASGSTLYLTKDYYYNPKTDSAPVTINKALTINGNGHTINAGNLNISFYIKEFSVTLSNLILKGGNSTYGGAIHAEGAVKSNVEFKSKLSVINTTFTSNHAVLGGSIYAYLADLTVINSQFDNSYARYGGAVYAFNSNVNIYNSSLTNSSALLGGSISSVKSNLSLNNNTFIYNTADYQGGAIYQMYSSLNVLKSYFEYNKAQSGGAIFCDNATYTSKNNEFKNNIASEGSAVYSVLNTQNIENDTYINNLIHQTTTFDINFESGNYTMIYTNSAYNESLPSIYDLRDYGYVTPVKNQGNDGNCWSFATLAALESCILKATGISYDLSEENMKNLIALYSDYGWTLETNIGGYDDMGVGYLTGWLGPVYESDDPYLLNTLISPLFKSKFHVQNIVYLPRLTATDNNAIKSAVINYGAVFTGIYYSSAYSKGYSYYNSQTSNCNHAVAIVGWDDNYSRNNFRITPAGDGAWICKNSWGSDWGDGGYFYVSYYDLSCAKIGYDKASFTFILNDTVRYDKIYQYDVIGITDYLLTSQNTMYYQNIFTAENNETIAAFSTYFNIESNWTAQIYVNNEVKLTQYGHSLSGYFTVNLNEFINVNAGDSFKILLKITTVSEAWVPISEKLQSTRLHYFKNTSFISYDGENWIDLCDYVLNLSSRGHNYNSQVASIKAFTIDDLESRIEFIDISNNFGCITVKVSVTDQYSHLINKGSVLFNIAGREYSADVIDGIAVLGVNITESGIFNIDAFYQNNTHYLKSDSISSNITVYQMIISSDNITCGEDLIIDIYVSNNAKGSVSLSIDSKNYTVQITDGYGQVIISNLNAGKYDIYAYYESVLCYNSSSVTVSKKAPAVLITAENIFVGEDLIINVLMDNATGNVSVEINGKTYTEALINSKSTFIISNLTAGIFKYNVSYSGDDIYSASSNTSSITVNKMESNFNLSFDNIKFGDDLNITVLLAGDATGNISLTVADKSYVSGIVSGTAVFMMANLNAGNYTVTVSYDGDAKYLPLSDVFNVSVLKSYPQINITLSDTFAGDDLTLTLDLNPKTTGNITVLNYSSAIVNGRAVITVPFMAAGNYTLNIVYGGDNNFNPVNTIADVYIAKKQSAMNVTTSDIVYGENLTVNITLNTDADVNVTVGNENYTVKIINGSGVLIIPDLKPASYIIYVSYSGNDIFNPTEEYKTVTVGKKSSSILLSCEDMQVGSTANINIELLNSLTGQVVVNINNKNTTLNITSDKLILPVSDLNAGEWTVTIYYAGDDYYNGCLNTTSFKVYKKSSTLNINVKNTVKTGDDVVITVTADNNVNGSLSVQINQLTETLTLVNGKVALTLNNLSKGSYNVTVKYSGNDIYESMSISTSFKVVESTFADLQALIDSSANVVNLNRDYIYDESVDLTVKITKTVTINGNGHLIDAKGKTSIFDITADGVVLNNIVLANAKGTDGGAVKWSGNNGVLIKSHITNTTSMRGALFVTGNNINITSTTFDYNNANTGGAVLSHGINTIIYDSLFAYNKATLGAGAVLNGEYGEVLYSNFMFNNAMVGAGLVVNGDNGLIFASNFLLNNATVGAGAVSYGQKTVCQESVFADNKVFTELLSKNLLKASDEALTESFGAGLVVYGDDSAVKSSEFVRNNALMGAGLVIKADNCSVAESVFENNSAGEAAGILSQGNGAVIDNTSFINNVADNGAGIVSSGDNITVSSSTFAGNSANTGAGIVVKGLNANVVSSTFENNTADEGQSVYIEEDATVNIDENVVLDDSKAVNYPTSVQVSVEQVTVGENAVINVKITSSYAGEITGNVTIRLSNRNYLVSVVNESAVQQVSGLAAGSYVVNVIYNGDDIHKNSSSGTTFDVLKIADVNITVDVKCAVDDENTIVTFNLPKGASGNITANLEGKSYNLVVRDSKASVELGVLTAGRHVLNIAYSGDDKYESYIFNKTLSVEKNTKPIIIAPGVTKYVKGSERLQVNVTDYQGKALANAKVNITINRITYTRTADENGVVSMALGLNSGNYSVNVKLLAGESYVSIEINTTVIILPTISGVNVTKIYRNATQYYAAFKDTEGKLLANMQITFNINGVFYNRTTNASGVARLNINLEQGEYILTAINPVNGEMYSNTIRVLPTITDNNDLVKYYRNESQYVVKLVGSDGNPAKSGETVTFNINGVFYQRTANATGHAKMNINLPAGNYVITAEYNGCKVSNDISVLAIMTADDLVMKYHDGSKFNVKLVNGQGKAYAGKSVTFNVNGVFYNRVTDDEGVAKLNINLMAGKYIITSSYNNFNIANTITING